MTMKNFILAVVAGLVVTLISNTITFNLTKNYYLETWVKVIDSAPEQYVQELDILLTVEEKSSGTLASARALVSARNDIASSLESLSNSINSEFTRLDSEIKAADLAEDKYQEFSRTLNPRTGKYKLYRLRDDAKYKKKKVFTTVDTIRKKWPAKKKQIKNEVKKILIELGLQKI